MVELMNLNYDLSLEIYNKCKERIEIKGCYKNIAHCFLEYVSHKEEFKDIKISFGAFNPIGNSLDNAFFKHCFFILDSKAIDPTLILLLKNGNKEFTKEKIEQKSLYFDIMSFDKDTYRENLIKCNGDTSLSDITMYKLNEFQYKLFEEKGNEIILLG